MDNFIKIRYYSSGEKVCYDDIAKSPIYTAIVNINKIVSMTDRIIWFCGPNAKKFPYRVIKMSNGERFFVTEDTGLELENVLIGNYKEAVITDNN